MRARLAGIPIATIVATSVAAAMFIQVEVRQVPVDRLLANLQGDLKADPANPDKEINLARLYGMAYALRSGCSSLASSSTRPLSPRKTSTNSFVSRC